MLLGSTAYGEVTGTLAGIVAVLLWIYTSVAVTLYAAELRRVQREPRAHGARRAF